MIVEEPVQMVVSPETRLVGGSSTETTALPEDVPGPLASESDSSV